MSAAVAVLVLFTGVLVLANQYPMLGVIGVSIGAV